MDGRTNRILYSEASMKTTHDCCFVSLALAVSLSSLLSNPAAILADEAPIGR